QRVRRQMHDQFSMGDEHENDVLLKDRKPVAPVHKTPIDRQDPVFTADPDASVADGPKVAAASVPSHDPEDLHDEEAVDEMTEGVIELHFATPVSGADLHRYTRNAV